jgi:small subunit ribosomal protein S16
LVKLRLKRAGRKALPIYKIVAADVRYPRDGRFIEQVGYYDPNKNPMQIDLREDRVMYWLKTGAQPTDTVRSLFKREGILYKWNLEKRGKSEDEIMAELEKFKERNKDRHIKDKERKERRKQNKAKAEAAANQPEVKEEAPAVEEVKDETPQQEAPAETPAVETPEVKEEPKAEEQQVETKEDVKAEEERSEEVKEEATEVKSEEQATEDKTAEEKPEGGEEENKG